MHASFTGTMFNEEQHIFIYILETNVCLVYILGSRISFCFFITLRICLLCTFLDEHEKKYLYLTFVFILVLPNSYCVDNSLFAVSHHTRASFFCVRLASEGHCCHFTKCASHNQGIHYIL